MGSLLGCLLSPSNAHLNFFPSLHILVARFSQDWLIFPCPHRSQFYLFIHLWKNKLIAFKFLINMNKVDKNIHVQDFVNTSFVKSLSKYQGALLVACLIRICLLLNGKLLSKVAFPFFIPSSDKWEGLSPTFLTVLRLLITVYLVIEIAVNGYLIV